MIVVDGLNVRLVQRPQLVFVRPPELRVRRKDGLRVKRAAYYAVRPLPKRVTIVCFEKNRLLILCWKMMLT